jgi:hypothetical protein
MCLIVSALFFIEERPHEDHDEGDRVQRVYLGHGAPHSVFPTMQRGGDGPARHGHLEWLGWALATLIVVFAVSCLGLGVTRGGRTGPARLPLMVGALAYVLIFTAIFVSYHGYMTGETRSLILGHPISTALMFCGVWAFPLFFALLFFLNFERWYVTPADLERLHELVDQRKQAEREKE